MKYTCTWKSPQNVVYRPVSDCRLRFDGEEKRGREVVHVSDTRLPIIVVGTVAVAVGVGNTEPDDRYYTMVRCSAVLMWRLKG